VKEIESKEKEIKALINQALKDLNYEEEFFS